MRTDLKDESLGRIVSQGMSLMTLIRLRFMESEFSEAYATIYSDAGGRDELDSVFAQILIGNPEILVEGIAESLHMEREQVETVLTLAFTSAMAIIMGCEGDDVASNIEAFVRRAVGG